MVARLGGVVPVMGWHVPAPHLSSGFQSTWGLSSESAGSLNSCMLNTLMGVFPLVRSKCTCVWGYSKEGLF
jgi:hypothetical protein